MGFSTILTPEDLKKGDLVPAGWYTFKIVDYKEAEASTDKSTNCFFVVQIQDEKYKGVSPRCMFNEKALGFGKNLWKALEFPYDEGVGYKLSSELFQQSVGSVFMGYVVRGKSDKGNEFNEIKDFKKA